jgi:hypothetical protein
MRTKLLPRSLARTLTRRTDSRRRLRHARGLTWLRTLSHHPAPSYRLRDGPFNEREVPAMTKRVAEGRGRRVERPRSERSEQSEPLEQSEPPEALEQLEPLEPPEALEPPELPEALEPLEALEPPEPPEPPEALEPPERLELPERLEPLAFCRGQSGLERREPPVAQRLGSRQRAQSVGSAAPGVACE